MERTYIVNVEAEKECLISGFVSKFRDTKSMQFIVLKDTTGVIQITIDKATQPDIASALTGLLVESVITVKGVAHLSEYVKLGGIEFIPESVVIENRAEALPITSESSIDQRLDYRWIDLRNDDKTLTFKVQTLLNQSLREYLLERNFMEIHSPKTISTPSESGAGLFEVKYFDKKAYLAQSPQFYKQMAMASGFERVFEVGPVFRAEESYTSRHTTEFTGFDIEMSYITDHEDVMKVEEEMLTYAITKVKEKYGEEIKRVFGFDIIVPTLPFPRITMEEAYETLSKLGKNLTFGDDFDAESEKLLTEYYKNQTGHEFLFVKDYPAEVRAFYHMRYNDRPNVTKSFDLYWKGIEITTGAQREHRYEQLRNQCIEKGLSVENTQFYLDFFRYGCPPHGGLGIGLDRITMLMLNIATIKDSMFIFRGPTRINP